MSRTPALRPGLASGTLGRRVGQVRAGRGRVHCRSRRVGQGHQVGRLLAVQIEALRSHRARLAGSKLASLVYVQVADGAVETEAPL